MLHHREQTIRPMLLFEESRDPAYHWDTRNKLKDTHSSGQGKLNSNVGACIDLQGLITCTWPYYDLSNSARPMSVLIIISYWSLRCSWCTGVNGTRVWSCFLVTPHTKLLGLDPLPQWLVLNLSKCWGWKAPDMKYWKGMRSSQRFCYIFYNFVLRREMKYIWKPKKLKTCTQEKAALYNNYTLFTLT